MSVKILIYDIETAPNLVHTWGLFRQNIYIDQIVQPHKMIMWSAKFTNSPKMYSANEHDDGREGMIEQLHALLSEADIVVGHNVDGFDIKWANTEFIRLGLPPVDPHKSVDTLKVVRNRFKFPSNKLDYVAQELGIGKKVEHEGFPLWLKWIAGDRKAINKMVKYCNGDVKLTQRLYYKLRPWIKNHPNLGLYEDKGRPTCSNCGSTKVIKRGLAYTQAGVYQRYSCNDCHTPLRGKATVLDKEHRGSILTQEK